MKENLTLYLEGHSSVVLVCCLGSSPHMWWNVPAVMAWGYGCPRDKGRRAATIMFNHPWHIIALIVLLNLNTHTHAHTHAAAAVQGSRAGAPSVSLVSSGPCLQWLWELLLPQVVHGPAHPSRGARPGHMVCGAQGGTQGRQLPSPAPLDRTDSSHSLCDCDCDCLLKCPSQAWNDSEGADRHHSEFLREGEVNWEGGAQSGRSLRSRPVCYYFCIVGPYSGNSNEDEKWQHCLCALYERDNGLHVEHTVIAEAEIQTNKHAGGAGRHLFVRTNLKDHSHVCFGHLLQILYT